MHDVRTLEPATAGRRPTALSTNAKPLKAATARLWSLLQINRHAIRDALVVVGLGRAFVYYVVQGVHPWAPLGFDARAYWGVDLAHPYASSAVGLPSTYIYPPIFAQVLAPLSVLPFPVFLALWTAALIGILAWLVRPWPWALAILALPISFELFAGNIHMFMAAVVVLGFTAPGLWAFPLLTKVTPGVGLVWFAVRREWRPLAAVLTITAAAVSLSVAIAPTAWLEWLSFVIAERDKGELLLLRLVLAVGIVAVAGLTNRRWLVPVGVWLALPVLWVETPVVLLAMIRLWTPSAPLEERPSQP